MLQVHENPQGGCPAGMEMDAMLRARSIMLEAVNEAMKPVLGGTIRSGYAEFVGLLEKEIVRSTSCYAISMADALRKIHEMG